MAITEIFHLRWKRYKYPDSNFFDSSVSASTSKRRRVVNSAYGVAYFSLTERGVLTDAHKTKQLATESSVPPLGVELSRFGVLDCVIFLKSPVCAPWACYYVAMTAGSNHDDVIPSIHCNRAHS